MAGVADAESRRFWDALIVAAKIALFFPPASRDHVFRRIRDLALSLIEERKSLDDKFLDSLRNALRLIERKPQISVPALGLTPQDELHAEWRGPNQAVLTADFRKDGRIVFVVLDKDERNTRVLNRNFGTQSLAGFLDLLENLIRKWPWLIRQE